MSRTKPDFNDPDKFPLEPASYSWDEKFGESGRDSRYSLAISMRRIADAFEQLVLFHLGPGEEK